MTLRTPQPSAFTAAERRLIARLRTPYQVQRFLRAYPYNWDHSLRTFRGVVATGRASCLEAVLFAATVLEQHGYPPLALDLESEDRLDHVLFAFRHRGRWGTVARSRDEGLHGRRPVFTTLPALVRTYLDPYVDGSGRIKGFGVFHLDDLTRADWRLGRYNAWSVERALIAAPHDSIRMGEARYRRTLRRFEEMRAVDPVLTPERWRRHLADQTATWW